MIDIPVRSTAPERVVSSAVADTYNFASAREHWLQLPACGVSVPTRELLTTPERFLQAMVDTTLDQRAAVPNWDLLWPQGGNLPHGERLLVMDFGCGLGVESMPWARAGHEVLLADINPDSLAVAVRAYAIGALERRVAGLRAVIGEWPYFAPSPRPLNVFLASGVLHHTPRAAEIMQRAGEEAAPDAIAALLLYTDKAFEY